MTLVSTALLIVACSTPKNCPDSYCILSSYNVVRDPIYTNDVVADKNNTITFTNTQDKVEYRIPYPYYVIAKKARNGQYYPIPVCALDQQEE